MADRGRGGLQQPRNPAAVSNPGSGRRTDGGAGSKSQPLRVASGGAYGQRKAATEQQQAAPLAAGPTSAGVQSAGGGSPSAIADRVVGDSGVFGGTAYPAQSNTAGAMPNPILSNPNDALRILYTVFPHPNIGLMIQGERDFR